MSVIKSVENKIKDYLKEIGYEVDRVILVTSSRKELGSYQVNNSFALAKVYHENPNEIANKIAEVLSSDPDFTNVNVAGGFVNISFSDNFYIENMNKILEDLDNNIDKEEPKHIFMDYGGANIAKTLHVGHLRSADIGEAVKRLAVKLGLKVTSDVHYGDIGRQSGMVVYEIKERYPELNYFKEGYEGPYDEVPIKVEDLQEIYPTASNKAKADEKVMEEVRRITAEIENGNKPYLELWNRIKELSKQDIRGIYDVLNTTFDLYEGETECYPYIPEMIEMLKSKNLLYESEGAMVVDVCEETDTEPMPPLVVLKENGGTVYQTRELATLLSRMKRFNPEELWYFTDNRQELYFKQVFRVAKKAGIVNPDTELKFFGFGTMNGTDGKPFKTRAGGVMNLKDLISMVKEITSSKISVDLVKEEKREKTGEQIAIAALKYSDLLPDRAKDFVFDTSKFADLDGKTGPYLLYSTVRINSLLEKANVNKDNLKIEIIPEDEAFKDTLTTVLEMPTVLTKALQDKSLNGICEYLYKLTSNYNRFYANNHIITCEDEKLKKSYLALSSLIYNINKELLDILAIEVPEKM